MSTTFSAADATVSLCPGNYVINDDGVLVRVDDDDESVDVEEEEEEEEETVVAEVATAVETDNATARASFMCGECALQFSSQDECDRHVRETHAAKDSDTFKDKMRCPRPGCANKFSERDLPLHLQCHDSSNQRVLFRCPKCPPDGVASSFSKWGRMAAHLWSAHKTDVGLAACPVCREYRTASASALSTHLQTHADERRFVCGVCGKAFRQLAQLRNHGVTHLDKDKESVPVWYAKKQCEICRRHFADSKCLKKHVQAVHGRLKPYICHVCNHQSARKAMLELHMRQHTGEKPYACGQCDYRTGDHNSLRRHRMRHDGTRPYRCPFCEYAAIQSSAFKNHVRSKHAEEEASGAIHACSICAFKSVNRESFFGHVADHKRNQKTSTSTGESASSTSATSSSSAPSGPSTASSEAAPEKSFAVPSSESDAGKRTAATRVTATGSTPSTADEMTAKQDRKKKASPKRIVPADEEDSLHGATTDLGGTTIPA